MKRDSTVLHGSTFLVTDGDGRQTRDHDGFYHRDMRHLDTYRLETADRPLETLETVDVRPGERLLHLCDPLELGARTLRVSRRQLVTNGLTEQVRVTNLTSESLTETLTLDVGTTFDDLFEVRGFQSEARTVRDISVETTNADDANDAAVTFCYDPADLNETWETVVRTSCGTVTDATVGDRRADATILVELELAPREDAVLFVGIHPNESDSTSHNPADTFDRARRNLDTREMEWEASTEDLVSTYSDVPLDLRLWESVLEESRENLLELCLDTENGPLFAAGVPWFATAFGRDSLIAAYQALPLTVEPAKGTCRYLAAHQADDVDTFRHAEPGKILHEIRHGELTLRESVPHSPYYGTIDATALFVILTHEVWAQSGDDAFVEDLWPHVERALAWLDEYGDRDGDGFVEYPTDGGGGGGLAHQAWKDSGDGIMHPDGSHPKGPLAVAEVQGYTYDAKRRAAVLARDVVDAPDLAETLETEAATLKRAFDEAFWLPEESFYAVALDGDNDPVETVATNPGHCLWSGIVPANRADDVIDRLIAEDMFSGWGIRTVSAAHDVYNPQSYHLGSIWPHDNSLIALGMARYERSDAVRTVAGGLVEAARDRGNDRLPELFAGFDREETDVPVEYGEACEPQAWAAATPIALLRALAGDVTLAVDKATPMEEAQSETR
ncbi:amylo-alpha-1,6-glucosidase [Halogranum rubrum]|nr:glycogen debranching N-terminal domain-containing protein [Halogranum rubrum]